MYNISECKEVRVRTYIALGLLVIGLVLALFKIYPTNYESLFTKINPCVTIFLIGCGLISVGCLFSNKIVPGEKIVSNISFIHLTTTLGLAGGFFSFVIAPNFISKYGIEQPYETLAFLYGPTQWCVFVPFLLIELWEAKRGLPKWMSNLKTYLYTTSMILAIGIALMAGCNSIPKIINQLIGIEISPYAVMVPVACLTYISFSRGIKRGMRIFSNLAMLTMYIVTISLIAQSLDNAIVSYSSNLLKNSVIDIWDTTNYNKAEFMNEQYFPFWIWMITWAGIMSPFISKIAKGHSLRKVVLLMVFGPSVICGVYAAVCSYIFNNYEGGGYALLGSHSWLGILYIIMLLLMFVTTADSTCYSLDNMISQGKDQNNMYRKMMWVLVTCTFVTIMMIAGSGTADALYGLSYITAPILAILGVVILIYMGVKCLKGGINNEN